MRGRKNSWMISAGHSDLFAIAFCVFAAAVLLTASYLAAMLESLPYGSILSYAIAFDLVITLPTAFYLLVIRVREWPSWILAPVGALCLGLAYYLLPAGFQAPLSYLELAAIPVEVGVVAYFVWRIRRSIKAAPVAEGADPLVRLREICGEVAGSERLGSLAATEIAMFWYLLKPPKESVSDSPAVKAFGYHRRSGHVSIVLVLLFLFAVEGAVVHYLLQLWNTYAAWFVTALTVYGALWLLADLRAAIARPVVLGVHSVLFRAGLRFDLEIPKTHVVEVTTTKPEGSNLAAATFFGEPTHWIILKKELTGEGPYGFARTVSAVGFTPDIPEAFCDALTEMIEEQERKEDGDTG